MAAKDRALVARLKVTVDAQSLASMKQQIASVLKQTAEDFAKAGFKDAGQMKAVQDALRATAERKTAEEKLQQTIMRTAEMAERAAKKQEDAEKKVIAQIEKKAQAYSRAEQKEIESERRVMAAGNARVAAMEKQAQAEIKAVKQVEAEAAKIAQKRQQVDQTSAANVFKGLFAGINAGGKNGLSITAGGILNPAALAGMLGSSNLGGMLAGALGPALAGIPVIMGAAREVQRMYTSGQDFLKSVALTQREVGLTKDQSSVARAFGAFTQDPNSPFANITVALVQAQLQQVSDLEKGLIEANPALLTFRDALDKVGISATTTKGEVKDVVSFVLELSKAASEMTPGEYAQLSTRIGGLFGKDFAAIYGADPKLLEQLATFSVKISDDMLTKANERTAAIQMAVMAEKQFELAATAALTPIDIQLNKIKQMVLLAGAAFFTQNPFDKARLNDLAAAAMDPNKLGTGLAKLMSPEEEMKSRIDYISTYMDQLANKRAELNRIANADPVTSGYSLLEIAGAKVDLATVDAEYERTAAALREAEDAQRKFTAAKQADDDATSTLTKRVLDYKDALKELKGAIEEGMKAEEQRAKVNEGAAKNFGGIYDEIENAGKGYDNFYENLAEVRTKIEELDAKAAQSVAVYRSRSTGKTVDPNSKDFQKLLDDVAKDQAQALDRAGSIDDVRRRLEAKLDTEAQQAAKKPGGGTLTVGDQIAIENYQEKIRLFEQSGGAGTSNVQVVNEQIADRKLQDRAKALGFGSIDEFLKATGQAPTTPPAPVRSREDDARLEAVKQEFGGDFSEEGLVKGFRKRGLTKKEAEERAKLVKQERELILEDRGEQFDVIKAGIAGYIEQLAPMRKENETAAEAQKRFNDAMTAGGDALGEFSRNAGLFDSVGFSRAVLEASLNAKLSTGGFGEGAEAVKGYTQAMTDMYNAINDPRIQSVLSGKRGLTQNEALQMGLVEPAAIRNVSKDDAFERGPNPLNNAGKVYSGQEVLQLVAQKQAIDIQGGVQKMFDDQIESNKKKGEDLAKVVDESFKKVFENPYNIKFELDTQSLDGAKAKLQEMVSAANGQGFIPPDDFKDNNQRKNQPPPPPPGAGAGPYASYYGTSVPPSTASVPTANTWVIGNVKGTLPPPTTLPPMAPSVNKGNAFAATLAPQVVKPGQSAQVPAGVQVLKIEFPKDLPAPKAQPQTPYVLQGSSYVPASSTQKAPPVSVSMPPKPGSSAPAIGAGMGMPGSGTTSSGAGQAFYPTPDGKPPKVNFMAELPDSEKQKLISAFDQVLRSGQAKADSNPIKASGKLDEATGPKVSKELNNVWRHLQAEAASKPIVFKAVLQGIPPGGTVNMGPPGSNTSGSTGPGGAGGGGGGGGGGGRNNNDDYEEQRAAGGPVRAGMPISVGEEGQELFVPTSDGFIVDAGMVRRMMWQSTKALSTSHVNNVSTNQSINYDVSIDARGQMQPAEIANTSSRALGQLFISNDPALRTSHRRAMPK